MNSRLSFLIEQYKQWNALTHSQWSEDYVAEGIDVDSFRSDNAILWQERMGTEEKHLLSAEYAKKLDPILFEALIEDDDFGALVYDFDGKIISRDLIDSIIELNFLKQHLDISRCTALDIGAGYGRFAHRLVTAFPESKCYCTDGIPESTFVSEIYLEHRGVDDKVSVIPAYEIEDTDLMSVDVAVNVHSFSECTKQSICWWLDLLVKNSIKYLFIIPNITPLLSTEADGNRLEFMSEILSRDYTLRTQQSKYKDPLVQQYGLYPCQYLMFERQEKWKVVI